MFNLDNLKHEKGQKYVFLNIRSLFCHFSEIELDLKDSDFMVFAVMESWLTGNTPSNLINIEGYRIARLDRGYGKKGGGVLMYIREDLEWDLMDDVCNISNKNIEMLNVIIKRKFSHPVCVSVVYIPPSSNVTEAISHLDLTADIVCKGNNDWILGGDFNIDLKAKTCTPNNRKLENFINHNSLRQLIKGNTRTTKSSSSLIDHIYCNDINDIKFSGIIPYGVSDHDIIFTIIKREFVKKHLENFWCRSLNDFSLNTLKTELNRLSWVEFYQCRDPTIAWQLMYNLYNGTLNRLYPFVEMRVKERSDWTNYELLKLVRERDSAKQQVNLSAKKDDENVNFKRFKELRGMVKRTVIRAKKDYIQTKLDKAKQDSKLYWEELNNIYPSKKQKCNSQLCITLSDDNNVDISKNVAHDFANQYFTSVGKKLAECITLDNTDYIKSFLKEDNDQDILLNFLPITRIELHDVIMNIDISKSSNIKNINSRLFKCCLLATIPQVLFLFNLTLATCKFPDEWKVASVTPIFKSGDRHKISNYRPISILPLIGKIFEKLLHSRIYDHLLDNDFLSPNQGGFRPGMGINDSIDTLLDFVYNSLNENKLILTIFYDLKKAFDTINHNILFCKLYGAGFRGKTLKLLKNYFTNRKQCCIINGQKSDLLNITCGVPQGSTLGPLMFIIYINDVIKHIKSANIGLYADDTVCYTGGYDIYDLNNTMNKAAKEFLNWCQLNRLTVNLNKSKVMIFSTKRVRQLNELKQQVNIKLNDTTLEVVPTYRYLGILLDQRLDYEKHINYVKLRISQRHYVLRKIRWSIGFREALLIFKSCILPYQDIGDVFYSGATIERMKGLQTAQNKCLRTIYGAKNWPGVIRAHRNNNILLCMERRNLNLLKFAHKKSFKRCNLQQHKGRALRSNRKLLLNLRMSKTQIYSKSYVLRASKLWNNLSEDFKRIRDVNLFSTRIKKELLMCKLNFPE